jgi:hypothetical protein
MITRLGLCSRVDSTQLLVETAMPFDSGSLHHRGGRGRECQCRTGIWGSGVQPVPIPNSSAQA